MGKRINVFKIIDNEIVNAYPDNFLLAILNKIRKLLIQIQIFINDDPLKNFENHCTVKATPITSHLTKSVKWSFFNDILMK